MSFKPDHEIYTRRFSRNLGVGLALAGFVVLSFFLTVEKVTVGDPMRGIQGKGAVNPDGSPIVAAPAATAPAATLPATAAPGTTGNN